ncbi:nitrilase-related carbon-nitrogen hydrolase [Kitasatospora sp. NPDC088346]|uniref:nitrilase-related carbon-nitrogen hydrolase n=1 Tax=Kitasatospora sp. NPDC088346 TaxID=3364073 RepID=UPI0037FCA0B4
MTHAPTATTRIACLQIPLAVGSPDANRARAARAITAAARLGARIVVLPELTNSGYRLAGPAEAAALAEPLDGPTVTQWRHLAARHGLLVVGGLCERDPAGQLRNSAVAVDATGLLAVYRKAHLWDLESTIFVPGDEAPPVVETVHGRIALMVCYDLEFPEWVRIPALNGADLLCAPVNWPVLSPVAEGTPMEVVRVRAAAAANRIFVAACDRTGSERGTEWVGGSVVVDPDGMPVAGPPYDGGPALLLADCALGQSRSKALGPRNDVHRDRRPALYRACRADTG